MPKKPENYFKINLSFSELINKVNKPLKEKDIIDVLSRNKKSIKKKDTKR